MNLDGLNIVRRNDDQFDRLIMQPAYQESEV